MSIPRRFTLLAVALLVLNSGALLWIRHELLSRNEDATGPVRIVETLPTSNVDEAERLAIVFNRDVGEPRLLNEAVAEAVPFQFSPDVPGQWEWTSSRRLEFVLDDPLPAGRTFKVTPAGGLESQLGRVVQVDAEIEFKTRPLELTECRLVSSDKRDVTFELKFNQKVSPDELIAHLKLRDEKSDENDPQSRLVAQSIVDKPATSIVLRCRRPDSNRLIVTLEKELVGTDGDRPIGQQTRRTLEITPVFSFLRTEVNERGEGQWQVEVLFNSGLNPEQKLPAISVSPDVDGFETQLAHSWQVGGQVLRLLGRFESGRRYQASLPASLVSQEGKPLGQPETVSFRIPDRRPDVTIPDGYGVLSRHGNLELELRTVNVGGLRVSASRVFTNNLVAHLQGEGPRQTSRSLDEKILQIASSPNETVTQILNLRELLNEPLGVYRISAAATDKAWTRDTALVSVTDLGLTLKQSQRECVVWVTSLQHARPVPGVRVAAVSYNNQTLAHGKTDEHGLVRLPVDADHPDGRPWVIIAEDAEQTAWLKTDDGHAVLDDVDQSGRSHPDAYDVMLYSERGTYRPGETIHLTGIVRDNKGAVPQPFPLSLHVIRPDGRTAKTLIVTPGQSVSTDGDPQTEAGLLATHGVFQATFQPAETAWTGTWSFRVSLLGSEVALGTTQAFVEEFVPVRLEVNASPREELITGQAEPVVEIESRYLFGQPAAGLAARVRTEFVAARFRSAIDPKFTFGPLKLPGHRASHEVEVRLDADGKAQVQLAVPQQCATGRWRAGSSVTVTEDGGRSVSTQTGFVVDRSTRHIGLRLSERTAGSEPAAVVVAGAEMTLRWRLRDALDQPADFAAIGLELQKVQFDQVVQRVNGRVVWDSVERTTSIWKRTIDDPENAEFPVTCAEPGIYRIIARDDFATVTELQFHVVSIGGGGLASQRDRPERLDIQLDKSRYQPGETARATITSPFPGTAIVCLESDRVISSQVIQFPEMSATVAIEVPRSIRGGAFVTATLLRPIVPDENEWLPHRARGIARLDTDHTRHRLPIAIVASAFVDPKDEIPLTVTTEPETLVHLWAVDEGILATSGFQSPDPHAYFFSPRKNNVISSDVFSSLLPDHRRPASLHRIGGDAGSGVGTLRRNPVAAKKPRPVVIWNGFFKADESGRVETTARLTQRFTGRLRWMAVAVHNDRYGSAQHEASVTQPLLVEASWPRYVSVGDSFSVPVKLINTTDQVIELRPDFQSTELSVADNPAEQFAVRVPPKGTSLIWQHFTAAGTSGTATATLNLNAAFLDATTEEKTGEYQAADWCRLGYETELSVRPVTAIETERHLVSIEAGEETTITVDPKFLPSENRTKLSFSSLPETDLAPAVESLLDYPYGCVEQTSSQLRALIAAGHVLSPKRAESIRPLVQAGISRLWSLQLRSGGLSYWPGQESAYAWGTAYAAETLLQAKGHGHEIDDRFLSGLARFLEHELDNSQNEDLGTKAAICCCLSRLKSPPTGWMAVLSEQPGELDMAARAHLALAWWHAGRREQALAAIAADTIDLTSAESYGDRPGSTVVDQARLLAALVEIDPAHKWIPILVGRIQNARQNGVWLSTLENALVLEALAAWRTDDKDRKPFEGSIALADQKFDLGRGATRELTLKQPLQSFVVRAAGSGRVSLCVQTTGLTRTLPTDADHLIQIRRQWVSRDGQSVDPQSIRVGDILIAEVRLKSTGQRPVENVAIVDALPGGFEIENPRLRTSDQSLESEPADHVQFLDDRVVLFATARPRESVFRFALRAVAAGSFAAPPIQASCMYNESISSIHGTGQRVRISPADGGADRGPLAVKPGESDASQK